MTEDRAEKDFDAVADDYEDIEGSDVDVRGVTAHMPKRKPAATGTTRKPRKVRDLKVSRWGIEYPSLPSAMVKKLATTYLRQTGFSNTRITQEALSAIINASDEFFERASTDVAVYAEHARRKRIEEADVVCLMKR
jgi:histone H3/H4